MPKKPSQLKNIHFITYSYFGHLINQSNHSYLGAFTWEEEWKQEGESATWKKEEKDW